MDISNKAVDNPTNVTLLTLILVFIGIIAMTMLPVELFPDLETPIVSVTVIYEGASPTEIEFQVIKKLEEEIKGLDEVKTITSIAAQGAGTIIIEFNLDADSEEKLTKVKDAVDRAKPEMPDEIEEPVVGDFDFAKIPIMNVLLYGDHTDYIELKDVAEKLKEYLELVPNVSNVEIFGGLDREISIEVNPISLWSNNVSLTDIVNFFNKGNLDTPGGKVKIGQRDYPIRVLGKFVDAADVKKTVISYRNGKPIYLDQLGEIKLSSAEVTSFARYNGFPAISLALIKEENSNLIDISDRVRYVLAKLEKEKILPEGMKTIIIGDQADEVRTRVSELISSAVQGVIAVFIVLFVSMGFRNALIASMGIPFAIIFTMIGLLVFDESINNLSQFGLILVVGIVVDGAIVVLENVYRYREMGHDKVTSAKEGTEEVGIAVISSGLTTMAAFAPMLFMTGIVGQFMSVIPKTVILALVGSILFDHIVIPVLCSKFLRVRKKKEGSVNPLQRFLINKGIISADFHPFHWIHRNYQSLIRWSVTHRIYVMGITLVVFIFGMSILMSLTKEVFPELDLGKFWVEIELPRGSSVEASNAKSLQVEKILTNYLKSEAHPHGVVKHYSASVGSSGVSTRGGGASGDRKQGDNIARIDVDMVNEAEREIGIDDFMAQIRKEISNQCVGAKYKVVKPKSGPPTGEPVNVEISGDDIRVLKSLALKVKKIINENIDGVINLDDNYGLQRPEVQIDIDRRKVEKYGLTVQEVQNFLFALNNGYEVANYQYGQKDFEIRLKIADVFRNSIEDLKLQTVRSAQLAKPIPLTELADIKLEGGISFIQRQELRRSITISGKVDLSKYTGAEVTGKVKSMLTDPNIFSLPEGYSLKFRGEDEETEESFEGLKYAFMVGVVTIYFIVVMQLKSFIQPFAILITVVLSIVGIALGLFLSGSNLGIMALFGGVSLAGIVVNDAIVLVSYLNILRARGMDMMDAVIEAGETRLRPILLTTFTTAAGLLPLALALGGGRKFWTPMGWSIIGGLLVATFQTLIVVPVMYSVLEDISTKIKNFFSRFHTPEDD